MKRFIKIVLAAAVMAAVMLAAGGCGVDDIDISEYSDAQIVISGLDGTDESGEAVTGRDSTDESEKAVAGHDSTDKSGEAVTIEQLKALDCVTVKTHSTSDKIGEVRATGPTLDTVLQQYGAAQSDFSRIEIYGTDGYDIALSSKVIEENDIILAFGIDGEPLDADSAPCRVIIPESDSAYWIRMVERIKLIK